MQNAMVSHQVRQSLIHKRQQINAPSVAYFLGLHLFLAHSMMESQEHFSRENFRILEIPLEKYYFTAP